MDEINKLRMAAGIQTKPLTSEEKKLIQETLNKSSQLVYPGRLITETTGGKIDSVIIVTDPLNQNAGLVDVIHRTNIGGLVKFILGAGSATQLFNENFTLYSSDATQEAIKDAKERLKSDVPFYKDMPTESFDNEFNTDEPTIDGDPAPKYARATKEDVNAIKKHIEQVRKASQHLENAVHELSTIPKSGMLDIPEFVDELKGILGSSDGGGLRGLLDVYYNDYREVGEAADIGNKKVIDDQKDANQKEEEEDCKDEDVKESADNYYDQMDTSFGTKKKPVNVVDDKNVKYADGEDKNEIPYPHVGDEEREKKVNVPSDVLKALRNGINEFNKSAERHQNTDQDTAKMMRTSSAAFSELLRYLEEPTIMHIKRAQVFMTTLMGPILHRIPANVVDFIAHGGQPKSLKDYMKKVKESQVIEGYSEKEWETILGKFMKRTMKANTQKSFLSITNEIPYDMPSNMKKILTDYIAEKKKQKNVK